MESPAGRRGSRGWPPAGQEGHPAVAQVGQVGARLADGPGRRGGQARGLSLERLSVGDGQPRLGQAPDVVRVGRPAGHHQRVDPLGAQAVELSAFHRRRALGVGHDHRVPWRWARCSTARRKGRNTGLARLGTSSPMIIDRLVRARLRAGACWGSSPGPRRRPGPCGWPPDWPAPVGQHPGHGGRADPGLGRHLTDVRPHRDDAGGGSVDAATAPPYCKRLHNQRGHGDGRRARRPRQQASDLVGGAASWRWPWSVRRAADRRRARPPPPPVPRRPPPADRGAPRRLRPAR